MQISKENIIFGLPNQIELAEEVAKKLKIKLTQLEKTTFSDGEILLRSSVTVRNKSVYIIASLNNHDALMELLLFVDSLKRASAYKIVVVTTYFCYSRQDRKALGRESIGAKLIARLLETAGVTKVITFDLHNPSIQGFFEIPVDDLRWVYPLTEHLKDEQTKSKFTIVSPDHGGAVRARKFAELITKGIKIAIIDKRRTAPNVAEVYGLLGDVTDQNCIIIDDIIDTGGTIIKAAEYLKKVGAKKIYLAATHGIFSKSFAAFEASDAIDKVLVSDSIPTVRTIKSNKLQIISLANLIARVIEADVNSLSISELYKKDKE